MYQSNAHPIENEIQVKKECDIEKSLGIKTEKESSAVKGSLSEEKAASSTDTAPWVQEKKKLIEKIVALQTENQRITFDLQNKISQHEAIVQDRINQGQQLSEKVHELAEKLKTTHSEAAAIKSNFADQSKRDKETIAQLTYKNKALQARFNQLQFSIGKKNASVTDSGQNQKSGDIYEVEDLIKHKKNKNGMQYLVRWKNFTPKDDTWEREDNLMCPGILEAYKRKKNL